MRPSDIVEILIQAELPVRARDLLEVSVHLPRRGSIWVASFRDETGRQVWRSTGLRDRERAMSLAKQWQTDAERRRAAQGVVSPRLTIRVRPGSAERQEGCLSQKEVALILRISERAVRQIEKRAIDKLRHHPVLKGLWRELKTGDIKEATSPASSQWVLSRAEIAAVYGLAKTPAERQALRKLITIIQDGCPAIATGP